MGEINRTLDGLKPKMTADKTVPSTPATPAQGTQSSQTPQGSNQARMTESERIMLLFKTRVVGATPIFAELTAGGF